MLGAGPERSPLGRGASYPLLGYSKQREEQGPEMVQVALLGGELPVPGGMQAEVSQPFSFRQM